MTPSKTRKAQERERKRALGLVPVEEWIPPASVPVLRRWAKRKREQAGKN